MTIKPDKSSIFIRHGQGEHKCSSSKDSMQTYIHTHMLYKLPNVEIIRNPSHLPCFGISLDPLEVVDWRGLELVRYI